MKVKICGMKRKEDIITACYEGADALGFIIGAVYKTPDEISITELEKLIEYIPPLVAPVIVTHLVNPLSIISIAQKTHVRTFQLQGDVSPDDIKDIKKKLPYLTIIKAIHVTDEHSIHIAKQYEKVADILLLDSRTDDRIGGTGLTHDWSISRKIVKSVSVPVFLAGGLTPENVKQAIQIVQPYGVDVNTGTKNSNGFKDPEKVRLFIKNAKGINNRCFAV